MSRIVSWFSCGAASAVATKLAIQNAGGRKVVVAYCDTFKREHPDNRRFFADCQEWFGQEILVLGNDDYDGDSGPFHPRTIALGVACWAVIILALYALADWVVPIPVGIAG